MLLRCRDNLIGLISLVIGIGYLLTPSPDLLLFVVGNLCLSYLNIMYPVFIFLMFT